jgi:hypothetical protein
MTIYAIYAIDILIVYCVFDAAACSTVSYSEMCSKNFI